MRWQKVCICIFFMCGTAIASEGIWQGGVRVGLMHPYTELVDEVGANGYGFVRVRVHRFWSVEFGWGYGRFDGADFSTDLWMGETRALFLAPPLKWIHPIVFWGFGAARHSVHQLPVLFTNDSDVSGWVMTIPVGIGVQAPLNDVMRLELASGYTYTYRDDLNGAILKKGNDTFFNWTIGLTFGDFGKKEKVGTPSRSAPVPVSDNPDDDGDGLTDQEELDF